MDHNTAVQGYKGYLVSGNPAYLPRSMEKTAAVMHDQNVDACKRYFMDKEARGGHPANIALARMVRPGIFPGMDDQNVQGSIRQPGDSQAELQGYMSNLMRNSDTAQAFRPGPHYDDLHEKAAAMGSRLTGNLPDKLNQRMPAAATGLPGETPGGLAEAGITTPPSPITEQDPTQTLAKTAGGVMWWNHLHKTAGLMDAFSSDPNKGAGNVTIDYGSAPGADQLRKANIKGRNLQAEVDLNKRISPYISVGRRKDSQRIWGHSAGDLMEEADTPAKQNALAKFRSAGKGTPASESMSAIQRYRAEQAARKQKEEAREAEFNEERRQRKLSREQQKLKLLPTQQPSMRPKAGDK